MRKFQCLLFVLKRSYICYYVICMTVPLKVDKILENIRGGVHFFSKVAGCNPATLGKTPHGYF